MNDRSPDVRSKFYQVLQHWLTNMEINSLRQFEHNFILFLLNGMTDEQADISQHCKELIEEHGRTMKDALMQMGEEEAKESMVID